MPIHPKTSFKCFFFFIHCDNCCFNGEFCAAFSAHWTGTLSAEQQAIPQNDSTNTPRDWQVLRWRFSQCLEAPQQDFMTSWPHLSVADHYHSDQDNVDVGSQGFIVINFIHLKRKWRKSCLFYTGTQTEHSDLIVVIRDTILVLQREQWWKKRKAGVIRALPERDWIRLMWCEDTWKKSPEAGYTMKEHTQRRGEKQVLIRIKQQCKLSFFQPAQFFRLTVT